MKEIVVLCTAKDKAEAKTIAKALVQKRLAACVNIVAQIESIYMWKGEVCEDGEALMIIKSFDGLFLKLEREIKSMHSYEVPEIVAVKMDELSADYAKWMKDVLKS